MAKAQTVDIVARKHEVLIQFVKTEQDAGRDVTFDVLQSGLVLTRADRRQRARWSLEGVSIPPSKKPYSDKRQLRLALKTCRKYGILRYDKRRAVWSVLGKGWLYSYRGMLLKKIEESPIERATFTGNVSLFGFPVDELSESTSKDYERILSEISRLGDELLILRARVAQERSCARIAGNEPALKLYGRLLQRASLRNVKKRLGDRGYKEEDVERVFQGMKSSLPIELRERLSQSDLCDGEDVNHDTYLVVKGLADEMEKEANLPVIAAVAPEIQRTIAALMESLWADESKHSEEDRS